MIDLCLIFVTICDLQNLANQFILSACLLCFIVNNIEHEQHQQFSNFRRIYLLLVAWLFKIFVTVYFADTNFTISLLAITLGLQFVYGIVLHLFDVYDLYYTSVQPEQFTFYHSCNYQQHNEHYDEHDDEHDDDIINQVNCQHAQQSYTTYNMV